MTTRYPTIYADPPWEFKTWSAKGKGRSAEAHYDCMPTPEIKALPVADLAAPTSCLFMWTTNPVLPQALDVDGRVGLHLQSGSVLLGEAHQAREMALWRRLLDSGQRRIVLAGGAWQAEARLSWRPDAGGGPAPGAQP